MRISDWSSDVCSSDEGGAVERERLARYAEPPGLEVPRVERLARVLDHDGGAHGLIGGAVECVEQLPERDGRRPGRAGGLVGAGVGEIGRASGREKGWQYGEDSVVAVSLQKKK